ncbi:MAG: hypothetical protein NTW19_16910 [Planctomycetota bacterium]|nr:hypothetical protein [Planctomycetota bacterium]
MKRATITADVDSPDEVRAFEVWLERWRSRLTFVSEEKGCGCCVRMLDVEGPREAIDDIPKPLCTFSDWSS